MKNWVLVVLCICSLMNCTPSEKAQDASTASIIGRWNVVGFEGAIQYEFTENKRYDSYAIDGTFETLAEIIASGRTGYDWWYDGEEVVVDLNFGNFSRQTPNFVCNNNVVRWTDTNNVAAGTYYSDGYDYSDCNE